ncbi:MAG TPA: hypothetical protein VFV73_40405 [Streptosporangiaceae bacterium]|nr:hypothetical protein [Streptosporangiaceae bacterium]
MSESLAISRAVPRPGEGTHAAPLDARRKLQLALGALWLLDGILQFQPSMFTRAFPDMLAGTSAGNPAFVASPVTWSAALITHHLVVLNAVFATVQVALGLGIAWRPAVRLALAGSVLWSLAVWFLGEGLGGVLSGTASLTDGAPGAVILYALLAVLLWPAREERPARFTAGRAVGEKPALVLWTVLWASMAFFALQPGYRTLSGLSDEIKEMAGGQPAWVTWPVTHLASLLAGQGLLAACLLAAAFAVTALGLWLPSKPARAAIVFALVLAAFLWLVQGLGGLFTGGSTDPNSGPLLVLLALAYWPRGEERGE